MLTVAGGILLAVAIVYGIGFVLLGIAHHIFRDRPPEREHSNVYLVFGILIALAIIGAIVQR